MRLLLPGLLFACLAGMPAADVSVVREGDRIEVRVGGDPFTTLFVGDGATKPYLHPLRAFDGTVVTRGYPMENIPGEQRDHPHHRGAWFSHGAVNGVDFWANEPQQRRMGRKGSIVLDRIERLHSGKGEGRVDARFAWKGPDGERLLSERRRLVFRRTGNDNVVDFDMELTAEQEAVEFGDTKEGTFAVRLATELEEPHWRARGIRRTGRIVAATGQTTEARTWGRRSRWVDFSGSVQGRPVGVAIFDHPDNPGHPTYWHVRGYGLFAANIFGHRDFHRDDTRNGSVTLARGESLRFRYRILVHPGRTAEADLEGKYREWADRSRQ